MFTKKTFKMVFSVQVCHIYSEAKPIKVYFVM